MSKNFLSVMTANVISLIIGAFLAFFIPYFLPIEAYGHYKQFTLYLSYVGLMHFGFIDGIYLKYGGLSKEEIPKATFTRYFRYLISQQVITGIILLGLGLFLLPQTFFMFLYIVINMILINGIRYFSYISQVTKQFKLYSLFFIFEKSGLFLPIIGLYLLGTQSFSLILLCQTIVNLIVLVGFTVVYREVCFSHEYDKNTRDIRDLMITGSHLMLGNFMIIMIFNIDKVMINAWLPIEDFSYYSFASNLLSIILVFVSSLAILIYPNLKRMNRDSYKAFYLKASHQLAFLASLGLGIYFPIKAMIELFLPSYTSSLAIFYLLLFGVLLRFEMEGLFNNLLKVLNKQNVYLKISGAIFVLAILLNVLFFKFEQNVLAFAYASLCTMGIWYLVTDFYFMRMFHFFPFKKYFIMLFSMVCFILLNILEAPFFSTFFYTLIVLLLNKNVLSTYLKSFYRLKWIKKEEN